METKRYFYSIDLLKFFLSLLILIHHFQITTMVDFKYIDFAEGQISFGTAVEFFFIISGFLSAQRIKETHEISFESYMIKKIRRLCPMAVLSVLCMTLLMLFDFFVFGRFEDHLIPSIYKIFSSIFFIFSGWSIKAGRGINNPLWYVNVLILCYILFYILLKISEKTHIKELYLFIFLCLLGIGIHDYEISLPFFNESSGRGFAAFFYGVILSFIYNEYSHRYINRVSYFVLLVCLLLGKAYYAAFFEHEWGALTFVFFPACFFTILNLERLLNKRLFKYLGGISYEIYIWHSFFNQLLLMFKEPMTMLYKRPALFFIIYAFIVVGFSTIMYFFVEQRFTDFCFSIHAKMLTKE